MQKYYNNQNFSKSLQSFCDRLFNCESTLCLERGVNRAYGNFVGNQPMLVNVCDLEPVPGAATLYWTSWSGSLYPFIFLTKCCRKNMPSGTGPIFGNFLQQVDIPF